MVHIGTWLAVPLSMKAHEEVHDYKEGKTWDAAHDMECDTVSEKCQGLARIVLANGAHRSIRRPQ